MFSNQGRSPIELAAIGVTEVTQPIRGIERIGRNEPCPCGSKKKYKKCCLVTERELQRYVGEEGD